MKPVKTVPGLIQSKNYSTPHIRHARLAGVIRWTGRIVGLLMSAYAVWFAAGNSSMIEGADNIYVFAIILFVSVILSWWQEWLTLALEILGVIFLILAAGAMPYDGKIVLVIMVILLPGLLLFSSWLLTHNRQWAK